MQKCEECGRGIEKLTTELIVSVANTTEEEYKKGLVAVGEEFKEPEGFICPNCAQIYLKDGKSTGVKLQPVESVLKYYGYNKEN